MQRTGPIYKVKGSLGLGRVICVCGNVMEVTHFAEGEGRAFYQEYECRGCGARAYVVPQPYSRFTPRCGMLIRNGEKEWLFYDASRHTWVTFTPLLRRFNRRGLLSFFTLLHLSASGGQRI